MLQEEFLHQLLQAAYENETINIYDEAERIFGGDHALFANTRIWAHQLVKEKLATYADEEKTTLHITHYGRFWMLHGGYIGYLHEFFELKERKINEKEQQKLELLEERLKLTQYRLVGFWLTLILSIVGMLSLALNLYLLLTKK